MAKVFVKRNSTELIITGVHNRLEDYYCSRFDTSRSESAESGGERVRAGGVLYLLYAKGEKMRTQSDEVRGDRHAFCFLTGVITATHCVSSVAKARGF